MRTLSEKTRINTKKFLTKVREGTTDFAFSYDVFRGIKVKGPNAGKVGSLSEECGICKEHGLGTCVDAGLIIKKGSERSGLIKWNRPINESIDVAYDLYGHRVRKLVNKRKKKSNIKLGGMNKRKIIITNINKNMKTSKNEENKVVTSATTNEIVNYSIPRKSTDIKRYNLLTALELNSRNGFVPIDKAFIVPEKNAKGILELVNLLDTMRLDAEYMPFLSTTIYVNENNDGELKWVHPTLPTMEISREINFGVNKKKASYESSKKRYEPTQPDEAATTEESDGVSDEIQTTQVNDEKIFNEKEIENPDVLNEVLKLLKSQNPKIEYLFQREKRKEELGYDETNNDISKGINLLFNKFVKQE